MTVTGAIVYPIICFRPSEIISVPIPMSAWIGKGPFILSGFRCDENQKIRSFKDFSQVDEIAAIKPKGFEK